MATEEQNLFFIPSSCQIWEHLVLCICLPLWQLRSLLALRYLTTQNTSWHWGIALLTYGPNALQRNKLFWAWISPLTCALHCNRKKSIKTPLPFDSRRCFVVHFADCSKIVWIFLIQHWNKLNCTLNDMVYFLPGIHGKNKNNKQSVSNSICNTNSCF